jgi:hypothetical protein
MMRPIKRDGSPRIGALLWRGPSRIDARPIVAIATLTSRNRKTGNMVQTWILRDRVSPLRALMRGDVASICGACVHGPQGRSDCYVEVGRAPAMVWSAYKRGAYADLRGDPAAIAALGVGRQVRLGAYGDPGAVPIDVWRAILARADGHTGYSHRWRDPSAQGLQSLCMASVDSLTEKREANAIGWRTFRVLAAGEARERGEARCPASREAGARLQCIACPIACSGRGAHASPHDIAIDLH